MLPDELFVRTLQAPVHVVFKEDLGRFVISSQAFNPSRADGTVSGDLTQLLKQDGLDRLSLYPAVERAVGAAAISIDAVRSAGCDVEHRPVPTDWYHGGITGVGNSRPRKRALQKASHEIVAIDQAEARRREDERSAAALRAQASSGI